MEMKRILIVDDEEDFAGTLAERLELRGYATQVAHSAEDGVAASQAETPPHVVILDLKMPGMDGIEALLHIKRASPETEVIMLTGHGSTAAGIEGMKRGLFDYLMKPVEIGELLAVIERALAQRGPQG